MSTFHAARLSALLRSTADALRAGRASTRGGVGAGRVASATVHAQELGDGVLLIASPELADPNFSHAVVLVLQHGDNGTIGVVLNRLTSVAPAKVFPELQTGLGAYTGTLFRGGPVGPTRLVFLVRGLAAATVQRPGDRRQGIPERRPRVARRDDEARAGAGRLEDVRRTRRVGRGPA